MDPIEKAPQGDVPKWFAEACAKNPELDPRIASLGRYLMEGDPLADSLAECLARLPASQGRALFERALTEGLASLRDPPAALRAFFEAAESVPDWVDWEQLDRGGAVFRRAAPLAALSLMCLALPLAYASPDGNKPLALSGQLTYWAPRRVLETAHFGRLTCLPGGLRRSAPGYQATLRVRLMHAQVRRLLLRGGKWSLAETGMPINQFYLASTNLHFSYTMLLGMRMLGVTVEEQDAQALYALWRYSGILSGVRPELCISTEQEAESLARSIEAVRRPADEDSRLLVHALMQVPITAARTPRQHRAGPTISALLEALSRYLLGDALADELGLPNRRGARLFPKVGSKMIRGLSLALRLMPGVRHQVHQAGERLWNHTIDYGLAGEPATYAPPTAMMGTAPEVAR